MPTAAMLIQYPEFALAVLLGFCVTLAASLEHKEGGLFPAFLAEPAKACLSLSPQKYLVWVHRMLVQGNLRSNFSAGDFASFKLYPF
ncbi:MAG: hypothetical protein ACRD3W_12455, partial [Terriglobales bacterium]